MHLLLDIVSWVCLVAGGGACLVGGIGVLRLPDFYSRLHASGVIDTLGAGLVLLGLLLQAPSFDVGLRLVLIFVFLLFTVPTATHALAKSALHGGLEPEVDDDGGEPSSS
ncbi:MAG: monovalent cation/H(+) antiporter subunit G [Gammaproteobacteria bacterium]|nr:monovalent cation/H(+) antiporter subunit G [Gammaproteobacteria bacterium]